MALGATPFVLPSHKSTAAQAHLPKQTLVSARYWQNLVVSLELPLLPGAAGRPLFRPATQVDAAANDEFNLLVLHAAACDADATGSTSTAAISSAPSAFISVRILLVWTDLQPPGGSWVNHFLKVDNACNAQ